MVETKTTQSSLQEGAQIVLLVPRTCDLSPPNPSGILRKHAPRHAPKKKGLATHVATHTRHSVAQERSNRSPDPIGSRYPSVATLTVCCSITSWPRPTIYTTDHHRRPHAIGGLADLSGWKKAANVPTKSNQMDEMGLEELRAFSPMTMTLLM